MGFLDKVNKFLPKRFQKKSEPEPLKNNVPKEKDNIKKSFAVYCNSNHGTSDGNLCAKCTALLTIIMPKMNRCKYGLTKPLCDHCDEQCFGSDHNKTFMEIMSGSRKKMLVKHPMMTVRHKITGMGVEYAKQKQKGEAAEKAETKKREKAAKTKRRKGKK